VKALGKFPSAHEAALAIARVLGPELSAERGKEKRNRAGWIIGDEVPLTPAEALQAVAAEGLALDRKQGGTGYVGVNRSGAVGAPRFMCKIGDTCIGTFASAEEAALMRARKVRDDPQLTVQTCAVRERKRIRPDVSPSSVEPSAEEEAEPQTEAEADDSVPHEELNRSIASWAAGRSRFGRVRQPAAASRVLEVSDVVEVSSSNAGAVGVDDDVMEVSAEVVQSRD